MSNVHPDALARTPTTASGEERCRLCGAELKPAFVATLLEKHNVQFLTCGNCGSLQTERPYWLQDAYAAPVEQSDAQYLRRNLDVVDSVLYLRAVLGLSASSPILDYGSGLGVVPRLLQELGINAAGFDTNHQTVFPDLEWRRGDVSLLVASEVLEHFCEPARDLELMFKVHPEFVYARTSLFKNQDRSWEYIGANHGQHVFFYSPKAVRMIADRFGYRVMFIGDGQQFFWRGSLSRLRMLLINIGLRGRARPLLRMWATLKRTGREG